jgi:hypothetical protein
LVFLNVNEIPEMEHRSWPQMQYSMYFGLCFRFDNNSQRSYQILEDSVESILNCEFESTCRKENYSFVLPIPKLAIYLTRAISASLLICWTWHREQKFAYEIPLWIKSSLL